MKPLFTEIEENNCKHGENATHPISMTGIGYHYHYLLPLKCFSTLKIYLEFLCKYFVFIIFFVFCGGLHEHSILILLLLCLFLSFTTITYALEKLGWPRSKTDEVLLPVLKQLNKQEASNSNNDNIL